MEIPVDLCLYPFSRFFFIYRDFFYENDIISIDIYVPILYFTFLFSLFVFVSTAGQYNVIWTGTGLPRFRFGSGTVPALLF